MQATLKIQPNGRVHLQNLGKLNPTVINGTALGHKESRALKNGDIINISERLFRFEMPEHTIVMKQAVTGQNAKPSGRGRFQETESTQVYNVPSTKLAQKIMSKRSASPSPRKGLSDMTNKRNHRATLPSPLVRAIKTFKRPSALTESSDDAKAFTRQTATLPSNTDSKATMQHRRLPTPLRRGIENRKIDAGKACTEQIFKKATVNPKGAASRRALPASLLSAIQGFQPKEKAPALPQSEAPSVSSDALRKRKGSMPMSLLSAIQTFKRKERLQAPVPVEKEESKAPPNMHNSLLEAIQKFQRKKKAKANVAAEAVMKADASIADASTDEGVLKEDAVIPSDESEAPRPVSEAVIPAHSQSLPTPLRCAIQAFSFHQSKRNDEDNACAQSGDEARAADTIDGEGAVIELHRQELCRPTPSAVADDEPETDVPAETATPEMDGNEIAGPPPSATPVKQKGESSSISVEQVDHNSNFRTMPTPIRKQVHLHLTNPTPTPSPIKFGAAAEESGFEDKQGANQDENEALTASGLSAAIQTRASSAVTNHISMELLCEGFKKRAVSFSLPAEETEAKTDICEEDGKESAAPKEEHVNAQCLVLPVTPVRHSSRRRSLRVARKSLTPGKPLLEARQAATYRYVMSYASAVKKGLGLPTRSSRAVAMRHCFSEADIEEEDVCEHEEDGGVLEGVEEEDECEEDELFFDAQEEGEDWEDDDEEFYEVAGNTEGDEERQGKAKEEAVFHTHQRFDRDDENTCEYNVHWTSAEYAEVSSASVAPCRDSETPSGAVSTVTAEEIEDEKEETVETEEGPSHEQLPSSLCANFGAAVGDIVAETIDTAIETIDTTTAAAAAAVKAVDCTDEDATDVGRNVSDVNEDDTIEEKEESHHESEAQPPTSPSLVVPLSTTTAATPCFIRYLYRPTTGTSDDSGKAHRKDTLPTKPAADSTISPASPCAAKTVPGSVSAPLGAMSPAAVTAYAFGPSFSHLASAARNTVSRYARSLTPRRIAARMSRAEEARKALILGTVEKAREATRRGEQARQRREEASAAESRIAAEERKAEAERHSGEIVSVPAIETTAIPLPEETIEVKETVEARSLPENDEGKDGAQEGDSAEGVTGEGKEMVEVTNSEVVEAYEEMDGPQEMMDGANEVQEEAHEEMIEAVEEEKEAGEEATKEAGKEDEPEWQDEGHEWIGSNVRRHFEGHGYVIGVVTHWAPPLFHAETGEETEPAVFRIRHEDGDLEDLEFPETQTAIRSFERAEKARKRKKTANQGTRRSTRRTRRAAAATAAEGHDAEENEEVEMDLSSLRVVDLRKELKKRGLSTGGRKAQLIERLQEALSSEGGERQEDEEEEEETKERRRQPTRRSTRRR